MERIICLFTGYLFGLIQTGYLYGRFKHIDIRQHGSGNAGSTNTLRVLGKKAGIIVFAGDFLKTLIPCLVVRYLFRNQIQIQYLLLLYTAFGVILGHNYPFYLKFMGGKGIAATAGLIVATDLRITAVCLIAFILIVGITRYVSLGSLVVVTIFFAGMIYFGSTGSYGIGMEYRMEFYIVAFVITAMAYWRHRANIIRLLHGNENKFGSDKK